MDKALYGLFVLTLGASLLGLWANGFSLAISLMLFGPVAVSIFTAGAFLYLLGAVIFEKSPTRSTAPQDGHGNWWTKPAFQHSNS